MYVPLEPEETSDFEHSSDFYVEDGDAVPYEKEYLYLRQQEDILDLEMVRQLHDSLEEKYNFFIQGTWFFSVPWKIL